jgi:hypothetical protein
MLQSSKQIAKNKNDNIVAKIPIKKPIIVLIKTLDLLIKKKKTKLKTSIDSNLTTNPLSFP